MARDGKVLKTCFFLTYAYAKSETTRQKNTGMLRTSKRNMFFLFMRPGNRVHSALIFDAGFSTFTAIDRRIQSEIQRQRLWQLEEGKSCQPS